MTHTSLATTSGCLAAALALTDLVVAQDPPQDPPVKANAPIPPGTQSAGAGDGQEPRRTTEPIVVSAQKWGDENVKDVPMSITPISAETIRQAGIRAIDEAARYVPNTFVTGFTARRLSFPYIRGVGSGEGDPAVATFVDDVPQLSTSNTNLSFAGLDRVEIMRGPNSALWGRNTVGGAINLITKQPRFDYGADLRTTLGNYDSQYHEVTATGPIIEDELAFSFSGSYEKRDGYTTNTVTNSDVDSRDSAFGRAQLLWNAGDSSVVRVILHGEETRDGGFVLAPLGGPSGLRNNPYRIAQDFVGETDRDILSASVVWDYYGDQFDFKSITSAQGWDIDESADFDFSQLDGVRRFTNEKQDYIYQEIRFESSDSATGPRWLVGMSGFRSDATRSAINDFRPGGAGILFPVTNVGQDDASGNFENLAISAFGQLAVPFGDRFEATIALRYDYEEVDARITRVFQSGGFTVPVSATDQDRSFERILPRASLGWDVCDRVTAYASASRGFKAGGFNLTAPSGNESFSTETSWTYEIGAKTDWCDERIQANVALFWIDWQDMQLSQFDATAGGYVTNAGESTSRGVELEVSAVVCDGFTVFGSAGFLDTEFDAFTDSFGQNVAGNDLPFAPEFTSSLGGQYTQQLTDDVAAFARADWFHTGEFYYDAGNLGADEFNLVNFRLGANGEVGNVGWDLAVFLHNAFDEEYVPIAFQANPADPTQFVGQNGTPQTWGVTGRLVF